MNIREKLQIKRLPKKDQKHGIDVVIGQKREKLKLKQGQEKEQDLTSTSNVFDIPDISDKLAAKIVDLTGTKEVDRDQILDRIMRNRGLIRVEISESLKHEDDLAEEIEKADKEVIPDIDLDTNVEVLDIGPTKMGPIESRKSAKLDDADDAFELGKPDKMNEVPVEKADEVPEGPKKVTIKPKPNVKTGKPNVDIISTRVITELDLASARIGKKLISTRLPKPAKYNVPVSPYYLENRKLYISKIAKLYAPYRKEILEMSDKASCNGVVITDDDDNEPLDPTGEMMKAKGKVDFGLLTHQKVVRDYINLYSPYRGLLLFHGLGSGKTCTSIAIAEGMKSQKRIFVMTPASLKDNFFTEMKKCADPLYRINQFWEKVSTEGKPEYIAILAKALSLPVDHVRKERGAWLVDVTKPTNFVELSTQQQNEVNAQLDLMIRAKYTDINYNGINMTRLREMSDDLTRNPFDNSVVVIDEAHNFVSRIVNKLPKKEGGKYKPTVATRLYDYILSATNARVVLLSGTPIINYPNELGVMYNMLRGYIKTWVFPVNVETSQKVTRDTILNMFEREGFNTYDFVKYGDNKLTVTRNPFGFVNTDDRQQHRGGKKKTKSIIKDTNKKTRKTRKLFRRQSSQESENTVFEEKGGVIKINTNTNTSLDLDMDDPMDRQWRDDQRNADNLTGDNGPHMGGGNNGHMENDDMVRQVGAGVFEDYTGVRLDETGNLTDSDFKHAIIRILRKNDIRVLEQGIQIINNKALPDDPDTFMTQFVDPTVAKIKNEDVFKRRILGLSSYFRSAQEKLLPSFVENEEGGFIHTVKVDMSEYQFGIYEEVRKAEEDERKRNAKNKAKPAKDDGLYGISSTYRVFSRVSCNFAFPNPPGRPMPEKKKFGDEKEPSDRADVEDERLVEGVVAAEPNVVVKKRGRPKMDKEGKEGKEGKEKVAKEPKVPKEKVAKVPKKTAKEAKEAETKVEEEQLNVAIEKVKELEPKKKVIIKRKPKEPVVGGGEDSSDSDDEESDSESESESVSLYGGDGSDNDDDDDDNIDEDAIDAFNADQEEGDTTDLEPGISSTYQRRIQDALRMLRYNPAAPREEEYLTSDGLAIYSPKFKKIVENLIDPANIGLHLLYSNFRSIEGIGILKLILDANGFVEFKLKSIGNKMWDIDESLFTPENANKPRYTLYTGTETVEEKSIVRNIYNSQWDKVPEAIVAKLRPMEKEGVKENLFGDIIKILMITASGAEGINLRNTRFVHITEPYWHMTRLEQVIGRARRICSHEDLPPDLRTVKVFLYISTLSDAQKTDEKHIELRVRDVSKMDGKTPITTDESLFEASIMKDRINQHLLTAIKETSMDCKLYAAGNKKERLVCYDFGKVASNQFASYPTLVEDIRDKDVMNRAKETVELKQVEVKGVKYMRDAESGDLYNYDRYKETNVKGQQADLVLEGKMIAQGRGFRVQML